MTRRLAELLNAPAVLAGFSRLVVDCNRYLEDPAAFVEVSDQVTVPGNAALSEAAKQERADAIYRPYHGEINRRIESAVGAGKVPSVVAVHTMTERMQTYLDMGDADGTRSILDEVLAEGNDEQKKEAQELLSQLG